MRYAWILLGLPISLTASPLFGQAVDSPYRFIESRHSITPFAGYIATDEGSLDLGPRSAPFFGGRYNFRFTGPLSGEAALGFAPSERTIYVASAGEAQELQPVAETDLLFMIAEAGLRFQFTGQRTWRGVAPFAVATVGVVVDLTSGGTLESEIPSDEFFRFGPGFALGIGLGSDFFVNERISIRPEIRGYLWRLSYPGGISGSGQRENEWVQNFAPTLGVTYHF